MDHINFYTGIKLQILIKTKTKNVWKILPQIQIQSHFKLVERSQQSGLYYKFGTINAEMRFGTKRNA